ncbi:Rho GTPase-activating protein 39 [Aphelenchoides besseyi]|nr:Rho GTPase-activating protein 39 [Aphelenchoides besseyi]
MKDTNEPNWVEIVDPKTRQRMFANLTTGQVEWSLPEDVLVKKADDNQWWELYDQNSGRFYYYKPKSTETTWQKPSNCDIIPLAKLQHLKENTEVVSGVHERRDTLTRSNSRQQRPKSPPSFERCYSNFSRDLSSQLNEIPAHHHSISTIPSSSGSLRLYDNGTQTEFPTRKQRFPSASSGRSRNSSTRSKFDNCLQEMITSQNAVPDSMRFEDFHRLEKSCSTSSSVSSGGQSADLLSQVTIDSSAGHTKPSTTTSNNTIATTNRSPQQSNLPKHLVWSKEPLKTPISSFTDKKLKKRAVSTMKHIMAYMGDRKSKSKSSIDQLVMSLLEDGGNNNELTDEIFLQIVKQLTDNPRSESFRKGWELLGIILFFFVPATPQVQNDVIKFVESCSDPLLDSPEFSTSRYAKHCLKRLQLPINCFKPSTANVQQARYNIFYPSMFGTSLEELMDLQGSRCPNLKIPWIEKVLIEMILENNGTSTEGVFRIAADPDQMHTSMVQLNVWVKPAVKDAHVPAALLKQWLRQLPSPVIPPRLYEQCLTATSQPDYCCQIVNQLPILNRLVLATLVNLLQRLCHSDIVKETKMDVSNLAMVIAPNILRCESEDPATMFADSRRQMEFMKMLILNYDVNFLRSLE